MLRRIFSLFSIILLVTIPLVSVQGTESAVSNTSTNQYAEPIQQTTLSPRPLYTPGGQNQWNDIRVATSVVQTSDGGYAVGGMRDSGGGTSSAFLLQTDSLGNVKWNQTYGSANMVVSVVSTGDGSYALAGSARSRYCEVNVSDYAWFSGGYWLARVDSMGNLQWNKTYETNEAINTYADCVVQTSDGGYALAGTAPSHAGTGVLLIKTDSSGNQQWNRTYEGGVACMVQTSEGDMPWQAPTLGLSRQMQVATCSGTRPTEAQALMWHILWFRRVTEDTH